MICSLDLNRLVLLPQTCMAFFLYKSAVAGRGIARPSQRVMRSLSPDMCFVSCLCHERLWGVYVSLPSDYSDPSRDALPHLPRNPLAVKHLVRESVGLSIGTFWC